MPEQNGIGGQPDPRALAASIEEDFRSLVEVLARHAEFSEKRGGEDELLAYIARAQEAARRGVRLSERLVRMAKDSETQD